MTAGFDSPLPPARTGVADYAAALLPALRRRGRVDVTPRQADVYLYHIGNNPLHRDIYWRALARPGVVVLHDAVLQHFFLGALDESAYVEEFVFNYGEWYRGLARELWRSRAGSGLNPLYYQFPMLKRIAERSRAIVVHNPAAVEIVRQHAPAAPVIEIPHLFREPALIPLWEVVRLRQRLGFRNDTFVFGVFGYLRESKRLLAVLRAFRQAQQQCADTALLIGGDFVSTDLARTVAPVLKRPGIVWRPRLPEVEFWKLVASADACINLRHPGAGETSGICVQAMGMGKPVVVTEGAENSRYPAAACLLVPPGILEQAILAEYMILAARSPRTAREIGRRSAEHIRAFHCLERVAGLFWEVLCAYRG